MNGLRRVLDMLLAFVGLVVLAPFLFIAGILILVEDPGPVFFIQERIGFGGRKFKMLKLRTMRRTEGKSITIGRDPRITRVGQLLRATKMDEFPQLVNVLLGEMTFVGPRPEVERYVQQYPVDRRDVLNLVPGITDPASLKYFDESEQLAKQSDPEDFYVRVIMPDKIAINLAYAKTRSTCSDLGVILATLARVIGVTSPSQRIVARLDLR